MAEQYDKLVKAYDEDAVNQYVALCNEIVALRKRRAELMTVADKNSELSEHVWLNKANKATAIRDLSDDHISNIIRKNEREGRYTKPQILVEADRRNLPVLNESTTEEGFIEGPSVDREY